MYAPLSARHNAVRFCRCCFHPPLNTCRVLLNLVLCGCRRAPRLEARLADRSCSLTASSTRWLRWLELCLLRVCLLDACCVPCRNCLCWHFLGVFCSCSDWSFTSSLRPFRFVGVVVASCSSERVVIAQTQTLRPHSFARCRLLQPERARNTHTHQHGNHRGLRQTQTTAP